MNRQDKYLKLGLVAFCLIVFGLVGCKPKISGVVFLDRDVNGQINEGDVKLGNVPFEIYVDDKLSSSGVTGIDGSFFVETKAGYNCVKVGSLEFENPHTSIVQGPGGPLWKSYTPKTAETDDETETEESEEETESSSTTKEVKPATYSSGESCQEVEMSANMNVKIVPEYSIADIKDQLSTIEMLAGTVGTLGLVHPESCIIKSFILPKELQAVYSSLDGSSGWNPSATLSTIDFGKSTSPPNDVMVYGVERDKVVESYANVMPDPSITNDTTVTVLAEAYCPDDTKITLSRSVLIRGQEPLTVIPTVSGGVADIKFGESFYIEFKITNNVSVDYSDVDLELEVDGADVEVVVGSGCKTSEKLLYAAQCNFGIDAGKEKQIKFKISIPDIDYLNTSKTYKSDADLIIKDKIPEIDCHVPEIPSVKVNPQDLSSEEE